MQMGITVKCSGCGQEIGSTYVDTAGTAEELQAKINDMLLNHRANCRFYNEREWRFMEAIVCPGAEEFLRQYRTVEGVTVKRGAVS